MEKMKRWISVLLTVCMLAVMLPMPAVSEEGDAPAPTQTASAPAADPAPTATQAEEQTSISSSQPTATPVPTDKATATPVPTDKATATPAPAPTDEATATATHVPTDEATATPVPTDEATGTPAPVLTDEATATPVSTDEETATAAPVPTDEATGTPAPVPTDEATATPTPAPTDEATGTPAPAPTDEAAGTPAPTDAVEVKTIASFEAVAPEGFAVPQGTLETDLGLPISLNAQFTDGAAGEVAVAWQCAAGYDPSAEAGTQFTFAAVLPQGYALAEGVSLPQIFVTLTPPLANAMLAAQASGTDWTLSDDGKLTVTGAYVRSFEISSWSDVQSIEVTANATFVLSQGTSFPGSITVKADGELENSAGGTLSGNITLQGGSLNNSGALSGSVTIKAGGEMFNYIGGTLSSDITVEAGGELYNSYDATLSCDVTVETDGYFDNYGAISDGEISGEVSNRDTISGGIFSGEVSNRGTITDGTFSGKVDNGKIISGGTFTGTVINHESITGGNFTGAAVTNDYDSDATSVTGGVFKNFSLKDGELTITGDIDLSNGGSLDPLTIALDEVSKIVIGSDASFNAGDNTVTVAVECNGAISGGTFTGAITGTGKLEGGDFTGADLDGFDGKTGEGANVDGYFIVNGKLTVTGNVNNSEISSFGSVESIEIVADASFTLTRNSNFSGDILIADGGSCNIDGTISDGEITVYGYLYLRAEGEITGSANVQISGDTYFLNFGTISGGTFTGRVENTNTAPSPAAISPARR